MAFFGLTTLGAGSPIKDSNAVTYQYPFHEIPREKYDEVFHKYLIGDCDVSRVLEVDGNEHILRASLGDMLKDLLGRQPRKYEFEAWFTYLDFDRSSVMSISEYYKALDLLLAFSAEPQQPKQYNSYDLYRTHWLRGVRVDYDPQSTLKAPLTVQQEVGWHVKKPAPGMTSFPLNQTDVTIKEGRNARSYYGHFIVD